MRGALMIFLLPAFVAGAEDAPRVLATMPLDGSLRVTTSLRAIAVVFDRDMATDGHSFVGGEGGVVPPLGGEVSWIRPRVLVVPLGALQPGTTYVVGLNSERHKGFRSAGGEPLPPTAFRFSTARAGEPPAPVVRTTTPDLGEDDVDASIEEVLIEFSEEVKPGSMSLLRLPGTEKLGYLLPEHPPYLKSPKILAIPVRLEGATTYGLLVNGPEKGGFVSRQTGEPFLPAPLVFTTRAAGSLVREPAPARTPGIEGRWEASEGGARILVDLAPDGRYVHESSFAGETERAKGKWRATEGVLLLLEDGQSDERRVPYRAATADTLEVQLDGAWVRLLRSPPAAEPVPPATPKKLVGEWRWCGEKEEIRIVLRGDGRYSFVRREGDETEEGIGRWREEESTLVIEEDGAEEPLRVPYRWIEETLEIEVEGRRVPLARQE